MSFPWESGFWPKTFDGWRLIPRIIVLIYGIIMWQVMTWFMGIEAPNGPQAAFVSTVATMAAPIFGFYVNGKASTSENE